MKLKYEQKQAAFTLIELIIVIAILAVLAAVAIPNVSGMIERANIAHDQATLHHLNKATMIYRISNQITVGDTFEGISSDTDRIQVLVDEKYFSEVVQPRKSDALFLWNKESQKWLYSIFLITESKKNEFLFSDMQLSDFIFNTWGGGGGRTWSILQSGLYVTGTNGNDMLFIGNTAAEYTCTAVFKLDRNPGQIGGLGIFFETLIDQDNQYRDTGYIVQFDRGFSEIIIRKRVNGSESTSQGAYILERIGNRSTSTIRNNNIPYKTNNDWWESEKSLSVNIRESETPGIKLLNIMLSGEILLSNYRIESDIAAANNHTGFRAWNNAAACVYQLIIDDLTVK